MASKIEAGIYKGRGVEGSAQTSRSSQGTEQVAIDLEIPVLGRSLTTFLYFSDEAAPYALERLHALGWEESDDPAFPGISKNEVDVKIAYETYRGEEKMKVDIVTGGGRVVVKDRMNAQEERGFMSRLKQLNRTAGPTTKKADAAAPTTSSPGKVAL
jgi:hypothetical protein